jgi:hypothetical protein
MGAYVIEATFTSYATGDFEAHSEVFAECGTFAEAALFALDCNDDGAYSYEAQEIDFPGDKVRDSRSFYACDKAEWDETVERERRDREEALMPFGAEWYREQTERW